MFRNVRALALVGVFPVVMSSCGGGDSDDKSKGGGEAGQAGTTVNDAGGANVAGGPAETGNSGRAGEPGQGGSPGQDGGATGTETGGAPSEAGSPGDAGSPSTGGVSAQAGAGGTAGQAGAGGAAGNAGASDTCPEVETNVQNVSGGSVSTVTGTSASAATDGTLAAARFDNPVNVAVSGQLVYVADHDNNAIRVVDRDAGSVSTLYSSTGAPFCFPFGLALGAEGELFVATDCGPQTNDYPTYTDGAIWRLDTEGGSEPELVIETNGRCRGLLYLAANADHEQGQLVFSDQNGHTLQVLDIASSALSSLAGMPGYPGFADGTGSAARFDWPYGLAELDGDVIVADKHNHALRRVTLDGIVTTIAGTGCPGLVDGPLESALFRSPQGLASDAAGNIYVADRDNHRVRVVHDGDVRTLAGGDEMTFVDGTGENARFYGMEGLDFSSDEPALVIADGDGGDTLPYHRIRLLAIPSL